jgi:hypothetical protein
MISLVAVYLFCALCSSGPAHSGLPEGHTRYEDAQGLPLPELHGGYSPDEETAVLGRLEDDIQLWRLAATTVQEPPAVPGKIDRLLHAHPRPEKGPKVNREVREVWRPRSFALADASCLFYLFYQKILQCLDYPSSQAN